MTSDKVFKFYHQFLFCVFILAGSILWSAVSIAQTSVWEVSKGESKIYLAGTIHLLRQQDYPLPAAFEQAFEASQSLYFETDIGAMSDIGLQQRMLQQRTYQDGRTLSAVLSAEAYTALSEYAAGSGIPLGMLQTFKPGLLISTLSVMEFQKLGFTPQGVDAYFFSRAMGAGKTTGELESIDQQIAMLARMGEGYESDFVLYSIRDFAELRGAIETMVQAWREGDTDLLHSEFVEPMLTETPDLYESILVERNANWMPTIEAMFDSEATEFVLVGVAHLVGAHGLITQLEANGYEVTQLGTD
ncbi:MAG: TraB/GumN family protein [Pseudohongiella sp.]|nr:TraB/GumN family protein [Pseudohongiella sp.]